MPSLHETYATLVRRGMPEHPRLTFGAQDARNIYWQANGGMSRPERMAAALDESAEADAADILTMHALRWWLGLKLDNATREIRILDGHVIAFEIAEQDEFVFGAGMVGSGHTTLDALIAATAHLEPKQTPPATS